MFTVSPVKLLPGAEAPVLVGDAADASSESERKAWFCGWSVREKGQVASHIRGGVGNNLNWINRQAPTLRSPTGITQKETETW